MVQTVQPIDFKDAQYGTPEWWLAILLARLDVRAVDMWRWNDYYEGRHPLAFFDQQVRERFGNRFRHFSSNFVSLIVDALAERFTVQGFRFDDPDGDEDVWEIWQSNQLDSWSQSGHVDAFVKGCAYTLVDPNGGTPRITIEDATNAIVAHDPRDNRKRLAGLKRWIDPSDGRMIAYVYLPDGVYKYRTAEAWTVDGYRPLAAIGGPVNAPETQIGSDLAAANTPMIDYASPVSRVMTAFERYQPDGEDWPVTNRLGVVPLIRLPNRPRLNGINVDGRSEVQPIASNQDVINYFRTLAVVAGRYLAMPQRYALNLELENDPKTGQPKPPFQGGVADLWVVPPLEEDDPRAQTDAGKVTLGQFAAADLAPYIAMIQAEVSAMGTISRVPYWYLMGLPELIPPSGESLNSSEAAFIRKVRSTGIYMGEGWEETMRVALVAANQPDKAKLPGAETIWANPETRNLAVTTDATIKQRELGLIDDDQAQENLGYTPQQRRRIKEANPQPIFVRSLGNKPAGITEPAGAITPPTGQTGG